jgi:hypothetical protein
MSGDGKNFILFACGMKRSGKSHLIGELARKFPRRLIFDFIGEHSGRIAGAREAFTLGEAVGALRAARSSGNQWTVNCVLDPSDVPELLSVLAPMGGRTEKGFSRAVGGLVIECGEVDVIAPNNGQIAPEVRNIFQRGRHHAISALVAVQRPASANRIVTSQADVLVAFRQHEPRDADYLGEIMSAKAPEIVRQLKPYNYVRYLVNFGTLQTINEKGEAIATHGE